MEKQIRRFRFSTEKLASLPTPIDGPAVYYDRDVPQLGLRLQPSGARRFFVLKKVAGKTFRKTFDSNLKIDAARKHAHKLLADVADWTAGDRTKPCPMTQPLDGRLTFQKAFEMYLNAPGKRVTNKEKADARRWYLFNHCLKSIAARPVDELTPTAIAAIHERLEKKHGPIMANRAHEVLRATFNHLIKKGLWVNVNPSHGATRAPKRDRAVILEADQRKPFLDALDSEENRDFAEFIALDLATGARKSNVYAAEWREIKFGRKVWEIPAEKSKNGKPMTIPLTKEALAILKQREARRQKDCPWIFPSKSGSKSGHVVDFKNQFKRLKKKAGLVDFRFHDIRRTFVANLIMANVPLPVACAASCHSNLQSMAPYARFSKGDVAKALDLGTAEAVKRMNEAEAEKREQGLLCAGD